ITGIITDQSIAFATAKLAQEAGATVVLTGYGRLSLVERIAKRLPEPAPLIELDVTNDEHLAGLPGKVREHVHGLDGGVHALGNLVSAGPLRTMAARSIPGFEKFEDAWAVRAPLGWDLSDQAAAAKAVLALLSDWFPATTGEIVHVDGGYHILGADPT